MKTVYISILFLINFTNNTKAAFMQEVPNNTFERESQERIAVLDTEYLEKLDSRYAAIVKNYNYDDAQNLKDEVKNILAKYSLTLYDKKHLQKMIKNINKLGDDCSCLPVIQ